MGKPLHECLNSIFSDYVLINTEYITSSVDTHLTVVRTVGTKDLESDASGSIAACWEVVNISHKAELGKELKDAHVDTGAVSETNYKLR